MLRKKWIVSKKANHLIGYYLDENNFWEVARVPEWGDKEDRRRDKNLITAAPALLKALKLVRDSTAVLNHLDREQIDVIEEAIAKAEGK